MTSSAGGRVVAPPMSSGGCHESDIRRMTRRRPRLAGPERFWPGPLKSGSVFAPLAQGNACCTNTVLARTAQDRYFWILQNRVMQNHGGGKSRDAKSRDAKSRDAKSRITHTHFGPVLSGSGQSAKKPFCNCLRIGSKCVCTKHGLARTAQN